jgi:hypothetical protein
VTKLLQCLRDELVRRDYAATTIRSYVQIIDAFRQHTGTRLDRITPTQLRRYHLFLLEERRLAIGTVVAQICLSSSPECNPARLSARATSPQGR